MEDILILDAAPPVRLRLKYLFWVRFSSAIALIVPTLVCGLFFWERARASFLAEPGGESVLDPLSTSAYAIVWATFLPVGILGILAGGITAYLAYRALGSMKRVFRMTPSGVECSELLGRRSVRWEDILKAEIGDSLILHSGRGRWKIDAGWIGWERLEPATAYVKARLPKEKIYPAPSAAEFILSAVLRVLPAVFALLLAAIVTVAVYWAMVRMRSGGMQNPALIRAGLPIKP